MTTITITNNHQIETREPNVKLSKTVFNSNTRSYLLEVSTDTRYFSGDLKNDQTLSIISVGIPGKRFETNGSVLQTIEHPPEGNGVLSFNVSEGSVYHTVLSDPVQSIVITGWPSQAGYSQRVTIFFQQDPSGNNGVTGWSNNLLWNAGDPPVINTAGNSFTRVVLDSFDGGNTVFGNWRAL